MVFATRSTNPHGHKCPSALLERDLVRLALAVYNYATDSAIKSRAITLFERLLLLGSAEAEKALGDWDRQ